MMRRILGVLAALLLLALPARSELEVNQLLGFWGGGSSSVIFDAATALSTGTGNITATHTPAGTPSAALVLVVQADNTDDVTTVTYGGTGMTQVTGSPLVFGGGEKGTVHAFLLASGVPAGAQTVTVTAGGSSKAKAGVVITLTGGSGTVAEQDVDVSIAATAQTNPSVTLGLAGNASFAAIAFMSGQDAVTGITPLANWTSILEHDFGSQSAGFYRYDIVGASDVTAGWTQASSDGTMIAIAVK